MNSDKRTVFNIREYGAVGDGKNLDNRFIQDAIDDCFESGGGIVYCPPGVYYTGSIRLKSNVTLHIAAGAVLLGSKDVKDYDPVKKLEFLKTLSTQGETTCSLSAFIYAYDAENVTIEGKGKIDGNGHAYIEPIEGNPLVPEWVPGWCEVPAYWFQPKERPEMMVTFIDCKNVHVQDVVFKDSFAWNLVFFFCDSVFVRGVTVRNPNDICNADGIDLVSSSNVHISDCDIIAGDDAICLKNTCLADSSRTDLRRICRNITVTNCRISTTCNGFKIGTDSEDGFENIVFSNSIIYNDLSKDPTYCAISGISLESVDGGNIRGITISNIVMQNVRTPLFIRLGNRGRSQKIPTPGRLQNVFIDNIIATGTRIASSITGLPGYDIQGIHLTNIKIVVEGGGTEEQAKKEVEEKPAYYPEATMYGRLPAYGFYCRHVAGLTMRNVRIETVKSDQRPVVVYDDVKNLDIDQLGMAATEGRQPEIKMIQVKDALIRGCRAPVTDTFLQIEGDETEGIAIIGNDLRKAKMPVALGKGIDPDKVLYQFSEKGLK